MHSLAHRTERSSLWRTKQEMISVWNNLEIKRQIIVIGATLLMFAAVALLARGASQKDMTLLFGGLEASAAGEVMAALDQRGVKYEVRSSAIYVDPAMRDSLRLSLAGEGLPTTGVQGYELLDGLSGFGTTSQMFDAAYWRAREGELARTILANPAVRAARVHISTPSGSPFQRANKPTAAVTVSTSSGPLSTQQVKALQYLVGAAVSGLTPQDVAIIDDDGGLISEAGDTSSQASSDELADRLRGQAERLLAARVGPGNAVVEVTVDTVRQSESIVERTVDPESRIAVSTDVTESTGSSQDSRGGDVSVASNLPAGDAAGGSGSAQNETSETRALTNFEISETQRQIVKEAGDVRRLTVAVLVNDVVVANGNEEPTIEPRSTEELAALEALVSSAVGLDLARGDIITLRSMPFEQLPVLGTIAESAPATLPINVMQLAQVAILGVVALILGLFVVRPIMSASGGAAAALPAPDVFEGDADFGGFEMNSDPMMFDALEEPQFGAGDQGSDAVARLRELIAEREQETVQILQDWIDEPTNKETI